MDAAFIYVALCVVVTLVFLGLSMERVLTQLHPIDKMVKELNPILKKPIFKQMVDRIDRYQHKKLADNPPIYPFVGTLPVELSHYKFNDRHMPLRPIQQIILINLPKAVDRKEKSVKLLKEYHPGVPVYVLTAILETEKGLGILKSHQLAIMYAEMMPGYTLICEDDFSFNMSVTEYQRDLSFWYKHFNGKFDVFLYSAFPICWGPVQDYEEYRKVTKATTATMYIVHPDYTQTLWDFYKEIAHQVVRRGFVSPYDHCDQAWHLLQEKDHWYSPVKPWIVQYAGKTSTGEYANNSFHIDKKGETMLYQKQEIPINVLQSTDLKSLQRVV